MRKLLSLTCFVILAFGVSCSKEAVEPVQETLAMQLDQEARLRTGERIHLNGKQPLIVIKRGGEEVDVKLNDIVPDDIETIHVLKNTSATSVYGEQGKNGVVIIVLK